MMYGFWPKLKELDEINDQTTESESESDNSDELDSQGEEFLEDKTDIHKKALRRVHNMKRRLSLGMVKKVNVEIQREAGKINYE